MTSAWRRYNSFRLLSSAFFSLHSCCIVPRSCGRSRRSCNNSCNTPASRLYCAFHLHQHQLAKRSLVHPFFFITHFGSSENKERETGFFSDCVCLCHLLSCFPSEPFKTKQKSAKVRRQKCFQGASPLLYFDRQSCVCVFVWISRCDVSTSSFASGFSCGFLIVSCVLLQISRSWVEVSWTWWMPMTDQARVILTTPVQQKVHPWTVEEVAAEAILAVPIPVIPNPRPPSVLFTFLYRKLK